MRFQTSEVWIANDLVHVIVSHQMWAVPIQLGLGKMVYCINLCKTQLSFPITFLLLVPTTHSHHPLLPPTPTTHSRLLPTNQSLLKFLLDISNNSSRVSGSQLGIQRQLLYGLHQSCRVTHTNYLQMNTQSSHNTPIHTHVHTSCVHCTCVITVH